MNNRNIIISADCTCDLPEEMLREYSVKTIPFYIMVNDARFQEGTEVNSEMLVDIFEKNENRISSTPASVEEYKEYFLNNTENGKAELIHISISSTFSSAFANATEAARDMKNVHVLDSQLFSHGTGLLLMTASRLVKSGMSVEAIIEELTKARNRVSCSFALKTTQYAAKNNRVDPTTSYLLDLFKVKPIIRINRNVLEVDGLCLSNIRSHARKYIRKTLKNDKKISDAVLFITVSGCSEEFKQYIYDEATKNIPWQKVYIQDVSATNFCNLGPESFGLMFWTK